MKLIGHVPTNIPYHVAWRGAPIYRGVTKDGKGNVLCPKCHNVARIGDGYYSTRYPKYEIQLYTCYKCNSMFGNAADYDVGNCVTGEVIPMIWASKDGYESFCRIDPSPYPTQICYTVALNAEGLFFYIYLNKNGTVGINANGSTRSDRSIVGEEEGISKNTFQAASVLLKKWAVAHGKTTKR